MEPILLIMAAGMGSRYGGLKQVDPVGPAGEWIIDYSLFDAWQAGFRRAIFVIRRDHLPFFQDKFRRALPPDFEISFAFQDLLDIPEGRAVPEGREKPWGTAHAVYAARKLIDGPFAVINADDYYGKEPYRLLYDFLVKSQEEKGAGSPFLKEEKNNPGIPPATYAMVGFLLKNTLSSHGAVARGLCQVQNGELLSIREWTQIFPEGREAYALEEGAGPGSEKSPEKGDPLSGQRKIPLSGDQLVSMNFWGFPPSFMESLRASLDRFFKEELKDNPLRKEAYLPAVVEEELAAGRAKALVLPTRESWMGVTYKEDKDRVREGFLEKTRAGFYPSPLWKEK